MTSKISLFNKGIYKSTVRRYIWGGVLYSILLFMITGMAIMFDIDIEGSTYRTMKETGVSLLLNDVYLFLPLIMAMFVPTVVALLTFRFVHSKKTAIFVHSLPVSRTANYISTILAAFTLMLVPVILNGVVLIVMSCAAYGAFFDVLSCFVWIGMNVLTLFLMFSVSVVAAMLTGNSFAMIGLNALIHGVVVMISACFSQLCDVFLYGYNGVDELVSASAEWNFVYYTVNLADNLSYGRFSGHAFSFLTLVLMLILALVLYVVGWILYKKRRMETAEEVAAFKCLNPGYKYLLTFITALAGFGLLAYMIEEEPLLPIFVSAISAGIVYFASEMILKKSFRIWKSWKGFAGFAVFFSAMICFFAFTSFFGYETRIPDREDIEGVAVYEYYYLQEPWSSDPELIDYATKVHLETLQNNEIYTVKKYIREYSSALHIKYKLKNGDVMVRRYPVPEKQICGILSELYKSQEYRMKVLELFSEDIGRYNRLHFNNGADNGITDEEKINEFIDVLKKDVLSLEYLQMRDSSNWGMSVSIEYVPKDQLDNDEDYRVYSIGQTINANFKNTLKWIKENGYSNIAFNNMNYDLAIIPVEDWKRTKVEDENVGDSYRPTAQVYKTPVIDDFPDAVRVSEQDKKDAVMEYVLSTGEAYVPDSQYDYYILTIGEDGYLGIVAAFYEGYETLMEIVK